jgi:hypothetical protein
LLSLFSSNGFGDAAQQVGSQAELLARDAALFDDVSDKLALTGTKVRGFWVGLADKVAPVLKPLLDRFARLDLASWGQQAGEAVAFIVQAFADGKVGDILFTSAKIAFADAVNFLAGSLMAVAQALWQALVESVKNAITLFQIVTTPDFWVGMGKALIGIAQSFIALLLDGVAKMLDSLAKAPLIGESAGAGAQAVRDAAQAFREVGQGQRGGAGDVLGPQLNRVTQRMHDAFANIGSALGAGFDRGSSLIDTSGLEQHLSEAVGSVMEHAQVISQQSREAVAPPKVNGLLLDPEEGKQKFAISAIQRIGGGGAAYGAGDPMLREQQRQTRELSTQTGLLRDVKRLLDRPSSNPVPLTPAFG